MLRPCAMHDHLPSDQPWARDDRRIAERSTPWFYAVAFEHRGVIVIVVSGDLDFATAPDVDELLREAGSPRAVVIDLTECGFIDSSGLQVLIRHSGRPEGLALCGAAGDAATRLLSVTGDSWDAPGLRIFPSRERALEELGAQSGGEGSSSAAARAS